MIVAQVKINLFQCSMSDQVRELAPMSIPIGLSVDPDGKRGFPSILLDFSTVDLPSPKSLLSLLVTLSPKSPSSLLVLPSLYAFKLISPAFAGPIKHSSSGSAQLCLLPSSSTIVLTPTGFTPIPWTRGSALALQSSGVILGLCLFGSRLGSWLLSLSVPPWVFILMTLHWVSSIHSVQLPHGLFCQKCIINT